MLYKEVSKFILIGLNQIEAIYDKLVNQEWTELKKKDINSGKRLKLLEIHDDYITPAVIMFSERYDETDLYNINLLQIQGYILVDDYSDIEHMRWNRQRNEVDELLGMCMWDEDEY